MRRRLRFLVAFAAYFLALWALWGTPVVYPLKIFVVLLHEVSHGLASVATGGSIQAIVLTGDQGGACHCPGGNAFLTLSAGYLGSLAWGLFMVGAARGDAQRLRSTLVLIASVVLIFAALYVRNFFGLGYSLLAGGFLLFAARGFRPATQAVLLTGLGLTSALYALLDIRSDVLHRPQLESDAFMLAEMTGIPTVLWGLLWIAIGLAAGWLMFVRAYRSA